jgi:hypothetical protein
VSGSRWLTDADRAELAVLVHALVRGFFDEHRPRCAACSAGRGVQCPGLREAVQHLIDWIEWRELRSKAEALRRKEEAHD